MKKLKNILFVFMALFAGCMVVDAASSEDAYELKWNKKYELDEEETVFYSVIDVGDGTISAGYRWFCEVDNNPLSSIEDLKSTSYCSYVALIVKHDKDGKVVWANDLYDEADGYGSDSYVDSLVLANDKIFAVLYEELDYDDEYPDESDEYIGLIEFSLDGELEDTTVLVEGDSIWYCSHLSYYNGLIGVAVNNQTLIYNTNLELVKELDVNLAYPAIKMNENGIYVVGNDYDDMDIIAYKFDYNYNKLSSKVLIDYDLESENVNYEIESISDINFYNGNVVIGTLSWDYDFGNLIILDDEFNVVKKKEYKDSYPFALVQSRNGLAVLETNDNVCELSYYGMKDNDLGSALGLSGVNDTKDVSCSSSRYILAKYDGDLNKLWEEELDYYVYNLDRVESGIVLVGYDYNYVAVIEKYVYEDYIITSTSDGNGEVTSSKTVSASGEIIEFTVTPKEGYELKKVTVTTAYGEVVEFTDYKFTMPSDDVEIYAEFEKNVNNPNTGLSNPYVILGAILVIDGLGYAFLKKKKYI